MQSTSGNHLDRGRILVAGSRAFDLQAWSAWLEEAGFLTRQCNAPDRLASKVTEAFDTLLVALYAEDASSWLTAAEHLHGRFPLLSITVLAVDSSEDLAIRALRAGVSEYVRGPLGPSLVVEVARRVCRANSSAAGRDRGAAPGILGESQKVRSLRQRLERLAATDCNVLITGESGTGKELAASAIHGQSSRRSGRLVCVNCAAIPDSLVESELFGRERGAFTGADSSQDGKLKAAHGGVIFLDEVGDLSLYAQAKILRAVETKEIYRLGSHRPVAVDARVVAATHRDLEEMVRQGQFRQDLFFRLNVGRVHVPPLRDRIEDLGLLLNHYLDRLNRQMGTNVEGLSDEAWECLARHSWPGNIRELKNLVESVLVSSMSSIISLEDLPAEVRLSSGAGTPPAERDDLVRALLATNWNKSKAAEKLQWSRMKLYRKMVKYAVTTAGHRVA